MAYAIKTPDGRSIYQIVNEDLPEGVDPSRVWPVEDLPIPVGFERIGYILQDEKVVPDFKEIPQETLDEIAKAKELEIQREADRAKLAELKEFIAQFEEKTASPELQAEALRLLLRDLLRRLDPDA